MQRPSPEEHDTYFRPYIDAVPGDDVLSILEGQADSAVARFAALDDERAMHRYELGKWSVKDVLLHLTDVDRILATRALRLARGEAGEQPGFDHDGFVDRAHADRRSIGDLAAEFALVRRANVLMYRGLPEESHTAAGVANGLRISVRMMPWMCAGHVMHHFGVLRERYGV